METIDFIYLGIYTIMIYCSVLWFSVFFRNRKSVYDNPKPKRFPSITFLVPVHNGRKNIRKCLDSLLDLKYPKEKLNVIVIDDGSTDSTAEVVRKYKDVKLIQQEHSGKASAMNNGLKYVTTELVGCMDADSFPTKDYLMNLVGYLEDKKISVATPAMRVLKTDSIPRKIQWIEYNVMIFLRKAFSLFNCEFVIPGPGGLYKTSVLKKLGGFDEGNLTEDTEIAFKLQDHGYKIKNSINAYVYTDDPKNFKSLWKQRIRWYRGYLQNVKKYSHMIARPKYGNLGLFLLPMNLLWIFIFAFMLFSQLYLWSGDAISFITDWSHIGFNMMPIHFRVSSFLDIYTFFAITFFIITLLLFGFSTTYAGEKINLRKRIKSYLAFFFIYPFLMSMFLLMAFVYEATGAKRKW